MHWRDPAMDMAHWSRLFAPIATLLRVAILEGHRAPPALSCFCRNISHPLSPSPPTPPPVDITSKQRRVVKLLRDRNNILSIMSISRVSLSLLAGLTAVLGQSDSTAAPISIQYDSGIAGPDGES